MMMEVVSKQEISCLAINNTWSRVQRVTRAARLGSYLISHSRLIFKYS